MKRHNFKLIISENFDIPASHILVARDDECLFFDYYALSIDDVSEDCTVFEKWLFTGQ